MHEVECTITGKVQMVGFRAFAANHARNLGVVGFVENAPEGVVHVVAQGDRRTLRRFVEYLQNGPVAARVDDVRTTWRDPTGTFSEFELRA